MEKAEANTCIEYNEDANQRNESIWGGRERTGIEECERGDTECERAVE